MVAIRDCKDCKKYLYDEDTGLQMIGLDGITPRRRPPGVKVMCETRTGCPKGTPENPKTLSEKSESIYAYYRECKAVGVFPDDPMMRHYAATIHTALEIVRRAQKHREISNG